MCFWKLQNTILTEKKNMHIKFNFLTLLKGVANPVNMELNSLKIDGTDLVK